MWRMRHQETGMITVIVMTITIAMTTGAMMIIAMTTGGNIKGYLLYRAVIDSLVFFGKKINDAVMYFMADIDTGVA